MSWSRFVRYESAKDGKTRWGEPIVESGKVDIDALAQTGKLNVKVLEGKTPFDAAPSGEEDTVGILLGPLSKEYVPIIYCQGLNYKKHILEVGMELPKNPILFMKSRTAIHDTRQPVPIPKLGQEQLDYEGELVIVIGKDCKNVSEADAISYVAGYCAGNDVSCRDWQIQPEKAGSPPQWCFSKGFDKYAPLGPCLVSPSILGDASSLEIKTLVNGETRQHSNTVDFVFNVRRMVSFFSTGRTLEQGTVIMTGTPHGVALGMKPPKWLKDGDEVVVEIEGIGKVVNTMQYE